jgi:hypothetical protein
MLMLFKVNTPAMLATNPGRSWAQMVTLRVAPFEDGWMSQTKDCVCSR